MKKLDLLTVLSREAEARPEDPDVWLKMAEALLDHQSVEPARHLLTRARDCAPKDPAQWRKLSELTLRTGDRSAALEALQTAVYLEKDRISSSSRIDPNGTAINWTLDGPKTLETQVQTESGDIGFVGDLSLFALADMLEFIAAQRASGDLVIQSQGEIGVIHLMEGRVTDISYRERMSLVAMLTESHQLSTQSLSTLPNEALNNDWSLRKALIEYGIFDEETLEGIMRLQIEDGILYLLQWEEGQAQFRLREPLIEDHDGLDARFVLLSAMKRLDESRRD